VEQAGAQPDAGRSCFILAPERLNITAEQDRSVPVSSRSTSAITQPLRAA
jgi:hypothetical protein